MNRKFFTTKNIWIECVDFYNRGYTFKEIQETLHKRFPDFGTPSGASTSMVIDLYGDYSEEDCCYFVNQMYNYLEFNCPSKKFPKK